MKAHYPPGALQTVTVKATAFQKARWTAQAKQRGMSGPGPLLALSADLVLAVTDAILRTYEEHDKAAEGARHE